MSYTFLDAVNRVLRIGGIIRADTDIVFKFSDLQHSATQNLAQIAIQSTLIDISVYHNIPMDRAQGTIVLSTGVREYDLASDFVQFWNDQAFFLDPINNSKIVEFPGGEKLLARNFLDYKTVQGYPNNFYLSDGPTKKVGFYNVPDQSVNGRTLVYDYHKDNIPTVETDVLPFYRDIEAYKFCELATVRFNAMFTQQPRMPGTDIERDPIYISARADLLKLLKSTKSRKTYGPPRVIS